jgi:hypothetical protein
VNDLSARTWFIAQHLRRIYKQDDGQVKGSFTLAHDFQLTIILQIYLLLTQAMPSYVAENSRVFEKG